MEMGTMRDLDQIRERDDARESSRLVLIGLGGLAAACVLFAVGVLIGREGDHARAARQDDPLARLDALAGVVADAGAQPVTYPERLVDAPAAGAVQGALGAAATAAANGLGAASSAATSALGSLQGAPLAPAAAAHGPAAALPAGALLEPSGRVRDAVAAPAVLPVAPGNQLLRIVPSASRDRDDAPAGATASAGSEGAFTLQVSSFRSLSAAQLFAQRLRERGHHAFVSSAPAPAGGAVWHRVRIGPFGSQREASRYRADFEARERLPTFVVRRDEQPGHSG